MKTEKCACCGESKPLKTWSVPVMVKFGTFIEVTATTPDRAKEEARIIASRMVNGSTTGITVDCEDPIEEDGE